MGLTPRKKGELLIFIASLPAERRKALGLKLNYAEAAALINAAAIKGVRDGKNCGPTDERRPPYFDSR